MKKIFAAFQSFCADESGATAIEYGLLASLIAVAIIVPVTAVGGALKDVFETLTTSLT
ncbi:MULTISPECIES: Flp family type IVb pilin [unclassified Limnohabitans]|uniref:Flp family type IVb pilin n=1 Tax=unclassified Limnohabitans TaxID=2626134 RepID=UPI000B10AFFE|nr:MULTISPECIES: Flp family type IVb pilin [unclassified Limnohabitans]OYU10894.1 MAG: Flp family type IVb pilin [Comamonadaceae bacterium PBBC1]PUE15281.1 Flp family type IVb pilin [Limnohabitans sp. WS1]